MCFSEENTPGGYSPLKMTAPLYVLRDPTIQNITGVTYHKEFLLQIFGWDNYMHL